jgi:hypothetical protein
MGPWKLQLHLWDMKKLVLGTVRRTVLIDQQGFIVLSIKSWVHEGTQFYYLVRSQFPYLVPLQC